jgi:hypothetical protein
MAPKVHNQLLSSVPSQMERDGTGEGDQPDRQGKLVLEAHIAPVEARHAEFAEVFEIARGEDGFCFHVADDGGKHDGNQVFS